jgi:DNA-directed RNA polymerase specialized sigma24 family protein
VVRPTSARAGRRRRCASEIDDGVQEVFIDCLRDDGALGRSDPARPFRPFLFGVARTVALRFEQRSGAATTSPGSTTRRSRRARHL